MDVRGKSSLKRKQSSTNTQSNMVVQLVTVIKQVIKIGDCNKASNKEFLMRCDVAMKHYRSRIM